MSRKIRLGERAFSKAEKLEILSSIECLPTRKAKVLLLGYSSVPSEMVKDKKNDLRLDELKNNDEVQEKLKRLRGLLAHSEPDISMLELINKLCDLGIKQWDPAEKKTRKRMPAEKKSEVAVSFAAPRVVLLSNQRTKKQRQYIKAQNRRLVWKRAQSQCENCESHFALQIEHINPKALGGSDELSNLKLLCRSCNQRTAIEVYGSQKMQKYLSPGY